MMQLYMFGVEVNVCVIGSCLRLRGRPVVLRRGRVGGDVQSRGGLVVAGFVRGDNWNEMDITLK